MKTQTEMPELDKITAAIERVADKRYAKLISAGESDKGAGVTVIHYLLRMKARWNKVPYRVEIIDGLIEGYNTILAA